MINKIRLSKVLAVVGTILVWLPIIMPLMLSAIQLLVTGEFLIDFLMPAELFPVALVGSLLVLAAAVLTRSYRAVIGGSLGTALIMLVGSQALAVATGLASGAREASGWRLVLVLVVFAMFVVALIITAIGGLFLTRSLFRKAAGT
jgi:hypothetical protein